MDKSQLIKGNDLLLAYGIDALCNMERAQFRKRCIQLHGAQWKQEWLERKTKAAG